MINLFYSITIRSELIRIDSSFQKNNIKITYKHKNGDLNLKMKRQEDDDCVEITPLNKDCNLSEFIKTIINIKNNINQENIDINLYILIAYKNQCNYELSIEELKLISELGCYITLSCYESDELEE